MNISKKTKNEFVIIIPVYNHEQKIADVIHDALTLHMPVIVVDDGSTDSTYKKIKNIKGIKIIRHNINIGKGAAIMTGLTEAVKIAKWGITIDADGQHNPKEALNLIAAIPDSQRAIIVGMRKGMFGDDVPWTSRFGRKFSNFWVLLSGGPKITDSQSGFRIYPIPECIDLDVKAKRFQFEVEILVKAKWKKIPAIETPISVNYRPGTERISHFRPFIDFMRNSSTFTRLIFQRIVIPGSIRSKWLKK